jgi:FMN-dependent NADH-azoreductase
MQLLHIDTAITGAQSVTRQLTADIVRTWQAAHPNTQVQYLDLAVNAPSHLSAQSLGFRTGQAAATDIERQENALSEALVSQFLASDVIVIAAPFYNFTIPTQLKAWIDRIAQAGRTFKYTEKGPVGLAGGKTVIVAVSRGGVYSTSEGGRALEHQEGFLRTIFGFMGITDVRFVRAEGMAMGPDSKSAGLAAAENQIRALATAANQPSAQQVA